MKKITRTVLIISLLGTIMVSCQKEQTAVSSVQTIDAKAARSIYYVVDGEPRQVHVNDNAALSGLLDDLLTLVEGGAVVTVGEGEYSEDRQYTKETVTFTTPSKEEATNWVITMLG